MRYGVVLPGGTATEQLEQAILAERAGWDGVFVWEAAYGVDPWSLLAAMAARTRRVRLGTMLTPLPWRRPWKVASEVATLDQLSGGRAVLTVGLGALGTELPETGEVTDLRGRAERLDEGIDLIRTLWSGGMRYDGQHYHYACERDDLVSVARPVQDRIPIWVVGLWPRSRSMRRVVRCDGIVPQYQLDGRDPAPEDLVALRAWLSEQAPGQEFDVIADGETPTTDPGAAASRVQPWAEAGATWWLDALGDAARDTRSHGAGPRTLERRPTGWRRRLRQAVAPRRLGLPRAGIGYPALRLSHSWCPSLFSTSPRWRLAQLRLRRWRRRLSSPLQPSDSASTGSGWRSTTVCPQSPAPLPLCSSRTSPVRLRPSGSALAA